jgi:2-polyprenyl-6-methoxyphenol hydroxylase-like FAD-dependent oxidoreductase
MCIDWKLMWRDPQEKWTSPKGRVIQIGDSAQTFLPSSATAGSMAIEDAFSLAACLEIAGEKDIPIATQVHNKLK